MKDKIHKFEQNGMYILLDINSGAVHVIDKMIYDMMDTFDGSNDEAVCQALAGRYPEAELREALGELHELMAAKELFAPDIDVPPTFRQKGLVKSLCLMIAQDCNLRCKYCFADAGEYHSRNRALMPAEIGKKALDWLVKKSGNRYNLEVDFFGGEPLLNFPAVREIVAYGRELEKTQGGREEGEAL